MTVVAAIARDGHVTMGADRATNYQDTVILGARKIARIGTGPNEMLLAASGSGSLLALRHGWTVDSFPKATAPRDIQDWADHIATALTELAATATPPILNENRLPGAFLLGWRGRLIYLFAHQATIVPEGVAGLGIGTDYALGYIEAILRAAPSNDDAIIAEMAVYGACERFDGCRVGSEPPLIEQIGAGAP